MNLFVHGYSASTGTGPEHARPSKSGIEKRLPPKDGRSGAGRPHDDRGTAPEHVRPSVDVDQALAGLRASHSRISSGYRSLFTCIAELERARVWDQDGCRDMAQWLSGHLGISWWVASRWVTAAARLDALPQLGAALRSGELSVDKVVDLARFATEENERELICWARRVSPRAVRQRADQETRTDLEETRRSDRDRRLSWWYDDDRFGMFAELPLDQGAIVERALTRLADSLVGSPEDPEDEFEDTLEARRADALVALACGRLAEDSDAQRATVVIHAELDALLGASRGCELEGAGAVHPEVARRLACDSRLEAVIYGSEDDPVGIGRNARTVPAWLMRQLRRRDRGCTFPGCGTTRYLQAHHIVAWYEGGPTDLDNLTLSCTFHHKLVHEYRWRVVLRKEGVMWFRPDGRRYDPALAMVDRAPPLTPAM